MATVVFWEKPGCVNNTRQKALLEEAGHSLQVRNLLAEPWTAETLRSFFGSLPVAEWFNRSAPAVKDGSVVPESLDAEAALVLMVRDPLLIRRPLMRVGEQRRAGFVPEAVAEWIGLAPISPDADLETCPRPAGAEGRGFRQCSPGAGAAGIDNNEDIAHGKSHDHI